MTEDAGSWPRRRLRYLIAANRRQPFLRLLARAARVYLARYDNLNYDLWFNGERFVVERIARHGPRRILDVGANVGDWALMASALAPDAQIDCFEVLPATARILAERVGSRRNVTAHATGLADVDADVALTTFANDHYTTMTEHDIHPGARAAAGHVITGDRFVEERAIEHIDLMKIDVEGTEDRVLRGFARTFAAGRIAAVQFEYGLPNVATRFLLRDFYAFFTERGFLVGKIFPRWVEFRSYQLEDEDFRGPNYLAVRRDRSDLVAALSTPR